MKIVTSANFKCFAQETDRTFCVITFLKKSSNLLTDVVMYKIQTFYFIRAYDRNELSDKI